MLTVYLVRHAQTEWNEQGIVQGWKDSPLTKDGVVKAELLGKRLKEISLDAVYASPTERAVKTAAIVSGLPAAAIKKEKRLMELNYGSWDGRSAEAIQKEEEAKVTTFFTEPHLFEAPGGDTFPALQQRAASAWENIINTHQEGRVLLVSHSGTLKCLLAYLKEESLEYFWDAPPLANCSLTHVEIKHGRTNVKQEGDTSHFN